MSGNLGFTGRPCRTWWELSELAPPSGRLGAGGKEVRADGKAGTLLHGQARWDLLGLAVLQR